MSRFRQVAIHEIAKSVPEQIGQAAFAFMQSHVYPDGVDQKSFRELLAALSWQWISAPRWAGATKNTSFYKLFDGNKVAQRAVVGAAYDFVMSWLAVNKTPPSRIGAFVQNLAQVWWDRVPFNQVDWWWMALFGSGITEYEWSTLNQRMPKRADMAEIRPPTFIRDDLVPLLYDATATITDGYGFTGPLDQQWSDIPFDGVPIGRIDFSRVRLDPSFTRDENGLLLPVNAFLQKSLYPEGCPAGTFFDRASLSCLPLLTTSPLLPTPPVAVPFPGWFPPQENKPGPILTLPKPNLPTPTVPTVPVLPSTPSLPPATPPPADCNSSLVCAQVLTCVDGLLYPTSCGPANCDQPLGPCAPEPPTDTGCVPPNLFSPFTGTCLSPDQQARTAWLLARAATLCSLQGGQGFNPDTAECVLQDGSVQPFDIAGSLQCPEGQFLDPFEHRCVTPEEAMAAAQDRALEQACYAAGGTTYDRATGTCGYGDPSTPPAPPPPAEEKKTSWAPIVVGVGLVATIAGLAWASRPKPDAEPTV